MSLATQVTALATRIATEIKTVRTEIAGRVATSRTISTTSPLTGGGDLSANRTLAVTTGTSSGTVATGDHTHSGYVPTTQRAAIGGGSSDSGSGTWAPDAAAYSVWRYVATGNLAVSLPTGGVDAQTLRLWFLASGGARVITFNSSYEVTQAVPGRVFTVPDGTWASVLVECRTTTWVLVAAYPQPVTPASPVTLTDAATVAIDASLGTLFRVTLAANRTLGVPTNGVDGQMVRVQALASVSAPRTLALTGFTLTAGITSPVTIPVNGDRAFIGMECVGSTWYVTAVAVES